MVTGFVRGFLKRKSEADAKKDAEDDVPDELPPLAEDSVELKESPKQDLHKELSMQEAPDELPPVDELPHGEKGELPGFGQHVEEKSFFQDQPKAGGGYFSNLLSITKQQGVNESLLEKNLFEGMRTFYSLSSSPEAPSTNHKEIESDVMKKLQELQDLEAKWKAQMALLERNKQMVSQQEQEIRKRSEALKPLLKKFKVHQDAPVGKFFRSGEGIIAKNAFDLLNLLKIMDERVFKMHVTEKKNDFASWIHSVIGDKELAKKLSKAKSKEEMVFILENASRGNLQRVDLQKYFKPLKGGILQTPQELAQALKNMDGETYNFHVGKGKNDFADWIKAHDPHLAKAVSKTREKEAMIKILEEYYSK